MNILVPNDVCHTGLIGAYFVMPVSSSTQAVCDTANHPKSFSLSLPSINLKTFIFSVVTEECKICKKWFHRLVLHLKVSKCRKPEKLNEVAKFPKNIFMPPQGSDVNQIIDCESDVLGVNHNYNSTPYVDGILAVGQRNEMDGLNDAQNAVLDEYFPNNGPKTSSECRFIDIFWKA